MNREVVNTVVDKIVDKIDWTAVYMLSVAAMYVSFVCIVFSILVY